MSQTLEMPTATDQSNAEADRDALLQALGFRPGPLVGSMRDMILREAAGLRPAMVEARHIAMTWQMSAKEVRHEPLLLRSWEQREAAEKEVKRLSAALASEARRPTDAPKEPDRSGVVAENEHTRAQELHEIADGAYGDGPAVRGAARDELKRFAALYPSEAPADHVVVDDAAVGRAAKAAFLAHWPKDNWERFSPDSYVVAQYTAIACAALAAALRPFDATQPAPSNEADEGCQP